MKSVMRNFISFILISVLFCTMFTGCGKSEANVWLADSIAPTSSTKGNDGDMYLNTSNYDLYQMKNSKWIKIGNIKGEKGDKGDTPIIEISEDGYWVINGKKTTTRAQGRDGKDGVSPLISISGDGYWVINGVKTSVKAKAQDGKDGANGTDGKDGLVPTIEFSEDGYWIINGVKTKIKAQGEDGKTPTIAISEDGYWVINGIKTKIKAECKNCIIQYQEAGNIEVPDLYNYTLTPVVYDGTNWKVADVRKKWYSYKDQEWANAVLLADGMTKNVGDTVKVDGTEALAMYVWIPRYEYKITDTYGKNGKSESEPGEIEINFIPDYQTTSSSGDYKIHPAFTFGDTKLSGMWVAKFEISHSDNTASLQCTNENCSSANNIRILPDKKSLRSDNVSSLFYGIRSMGQKGNVFGIDSEVTDSHMIKNSEWGAVAYLTQSKYGKYGNSDYTGLEKEVYINNSQYFITGRSGGSYAGNTPINKTYTDQTSTTKYIPNGFYTYDGYLIKYASNTKTSTRNMNKVASTTGNITGIYDMSGGSRDYVMGVYADSNGELWSGGTSDKNSGFKGKIGTTGSTDGLDWPNKKYYDVYSKIELSSACDGKICYGHALSETNGWYGDAITFVSKDLPWLSRGGLYNNSNTAGIFYSFNQDGSSFDAAATRSVLVSTGKSSDLKIYSNGEVVYYNVATGKKCTNYNEENSKTGYNGIDKKTGNQNSCLKFYAFNDQGSSILNLVLDHNTTSTIEWNSSGNNSDGPKEVLEQLKKDTKDWKGTLMPSNYTTGILGRQYTVNYNGYTSRLITAKEIAQITENTSYDENNSTTNLIFYFDTNTNDKGACQNGKLSECRYGWLYDRTAKDCENGGCLNNSNEITKGYWTASSNPQLSDQPDHALCNKRMSYGISHNGRLGHACPNNISHYGVRPVIEVSKSNL